MKFIDPIYIVCIRYSTIETKEAILGFFFRIRFDGRHHLSTNAEKATRYIHYG
jgi:hypothetical protein